VTGPDSINTEAFDKAVANLALVGNYQRQNALIAFTMLKVAETRTQLSLCQRLESGFETAYWPGRFQWLPEPGIILDGAHNVAGARALRSALDDYFPKKPRTFILSFFQNKDIEGALKSLLRPNDRVVASQCHSPRAVASAADIVRQSENLGATAISASSVAQALQMACENRRADDLIVVTGSFATVKETMVCLGWHSVQDGFKSTYGLGQESCKIHKQRSR